MSYGPGWNRLAVCSAGMLSVHPYFNPAIAVKGFHHGYDMGEFNSPKVELISPLSYPAGAKSFSVQFRIAASGARSLHQVIFFLKTKWPHPADGLQEVKSCQIFAGQNQAVATFNYDGIIPSEGVSSLSASQYVAVLAVDTEGNANTGPATAATDFNGDGKTDFADFFLFADAYGGTDAKFDLDGSGTVDFADFFKFIDAFGS